MNQFAAKIAKDQQQDIEKLERLETALAQSVTDSRAHQHGTTAQPGATEERSSDPGMMGQADDVRMRQQMLDKLESLSGDAFDEAFLRSIAPAPPYGESRCPSQRRSSNPQR